jgi:hypothetical protein
LSEVRANEVTRIYAQPEVLKELPLGLRMPGEGGDFDETLWSAAMIREHLDYYDGTDARGVYRVLYVNDARWGAFATDDGEHLLPESDYGGDLPALNSCWAELSFCEDAQIMGGGADKTVVGLVTPGVVVSATMTAEGDHELTLERRGDDDAATIGDWLLSGTLVSRYATCNPFIDVMMAQLFVEASVNDCNGDLIAGSYLVAGKEIDEDQQMCAFDSSEWHLTLDLEPGTTDKVLDLLTRRGPDFSSVVAAARDPKSRAGRARRKAVRSWERDHPT